MKPIWDDVRQAILSGLGTLAILGMATQVLGQQRTSQIGYVYPAGGRQGSTFEVVVAGQFLSGADKILVSGSGIQATITEMVRPMTGREVNDLPASAGKREFQNVFHGQSPV